jgi:hypothetical protein
MSEQIRFRQPFVGRCYVYILLAEVMRMAAMQGFRDNCLLTLLLCSSSVRSSFASARAMSSGVHQSSAFTVATRRDDTASLLTFWRWNFIFKF